MPTKSFTYLDATITVHAPVFGNNITVDVSCRDYQATGLTTDEFGAIIYPCVTAQAGGPPIGGMSDGLEVEETT